MSDYNHSRKSELYERLLKFGRDCRSLVKKLPKVTANFEDGKQLVRSSGSVGANYIEAWEAISKKDELHRLKICRKEAKESRHWLNLVDSGNDANLDTESKRLAQEALEITKIFGAIVHNQEGTRVKKVD